MRVLRARLRSTLDRWRLGMSESTQLNPRILSIVRRDGEQSGRFHAWA